METIAIMHLAWALFWSVTSISISYIWVQEIKAKKDVEIAKISKGKLK